jgi:hypothetical protein
MDAILTLGVTRVIDNILGPAGGGPAAAEEISSEQLGSLSRLARRDLLLLGAFYDRSLSMPRKQRWNMLRRKLRYWSWPTEWDRALGSGPGDCRHRGDDRPVGVLEQASRLLYEL